MIALCSQINHFDAISMLPDLHRHPLSSLHIISKNLSQARQGALPLLEGLSEEEELGLVVDGQDTGTGNTTEDVGTSTLEEGLDALLGEDLAGGIERGRVLDGL